MAFFHLLAWTAARRTATLLAGIACVIPAPGRAAALNASDSPAIVRQPVTTHLAMGTLVSVSADTLVLRHTVYGRQVSEPFQLTPATQRVGALEPGVKVTVQYQVDRAVKRATFVKARRTSAEHEAPGGHAVPGATSPPTGKTGER